ncbi:MAG TPA: hypothetical protein PLX89_17340 [Verrucomicrobiota bacterium]|nr:hypothetical protein [Verrucomicrobiota bacterium]
MNTEGRYRDRIEFQSFQTFQSLRDLGIGTVLRDRPGGHGSQEIDLAGLVDETSVVGAYRISEATRALADLSFSRQCCRAPDEKVNRKRREHCQIVTNPKVFHITRFFGTMALELASVHR